MNKVVLKISSSVILGITLLAMASQSAHAASDGYFPHTREKLKYALHTYDGTAGKLAYSGVKRTARIVGAPLVGISRGIKESFYYVPTFYGPMMTYDPIRGGVYGIWAAGKTMVSGGLLPKSVRPGDRESFESAK
jgi:hypothetical protein